MAFQQVSLQTTSSLGEQLPLEFIHANLPTAGHKRCDLPRRHYSNKDHSPAKCVGTLLTAHGLAGRESIWECGRGTSSRALG
jgi:hypothetical protein